VKRIRTQFSVAGFTEVEVQGGLANLREEFGQRPWFLSAEAVWDNSRRLLVIVVEREGQSPEVDGPDVRAALDEVWDCVIACLNFESDGIHFDVESSCIV
jgi:hypothetical protein